MSALPMPPAANEPEASPLDRGQASATAPVGATAAEPVARQLTVDSLSLVFKTRHGTVKALEDMGAEVIGAACIADRRADDCDFALPVYAALKLTIDSYEPDDCPICKEGKLKLEKPGSRELAAEK